MTYAVTLVSMFQDHLCVCARLGTIFPAMGGFVTVCFSSNANLIRVYLKSIDVVCS